MPHDVIHQHICYEIENEMFELNARKDNEKRFADF